MMSKSRGSGRLRVVLAGAGAISHYHLIAWSRERRAEVVAICDPDPAKARGRAEQFGIARVYPRLEDALSDGGIDAVDIAAPRAAHAGLVQVAAEQGLGVLCQKPVTPTLVEGKALAARVSGLGRVMVHENWRFRPWYRRIRQWLDLGLLGGLQQADMAMLSSGLLPDLSGQRPLLVRQPFMLHERRLMITEVLIHHLDVLRWLFGPLRVLDARTAHTLPELIGESLAVILLETSDRMPITLRGSMVASSLPVRTQDQFEAIGDRATIRLGGMTLSLLAKEARRERFDFARSYQQSFDATIRHFIDRLTDGQPFETNLADNLETLSLVEDAYAAAGGS
jgi:predicted dehydrogenase